VYRSRKDPAILFVPNSTLFVVQHAPHTDAAPYFPGLADNDPNRLATELDAAVRRLNRNGMWFVMTPESELAAAFKQAFLGGKPIFKMKKGKFPSEPKDDSESKDDDSKKARLALKKSKLITFVANPTSDGKALKADLTFECSSDADAKELETALSPQKDKLAIFLANIAPFAPTPTIVEQLVTELKASIEFKVAGANLQISMKIGESVWDVLKTFQEEQEKAEKDEE
jgi:hypothetical protein